MAIISRTSCTVLVCCRSDGGHCSSSGPSAGRTRLRYIHCRANSAHQADADRWRQRVCRGDRMKRREFIALSIGGHGVGYALPTR
jgi:hypothetical protein